MGFNVFHGVAKKYQDSKLFQASLLASELNFAVRSPAVYKNISYYLKDVDEFREEMVKLKGEEK